MEEDPPIRRLTAIVAIDVVGSSTMSAHDEEAALALMHERTRTAEHIVEARRGRVFKHTGDGLLAEFASPVEAVRAAADIQRAMRQANAEGARDRQLTLRIGINLGDVVERDGDLLGDAVNVAVRLESIAPAGGICISQAVREQIVGKLSWTVADLGDQRLKNIPRPVRAHSVLLDGQAPVSAPSRRGVSRVALVGSLAFVVLAGIVAVGLWFSGVLESPPPKTQASAPTDGPQVAAGLPVRPFAAVDVPFVRESRRKQLESYGRAAGAKALAINPRGVAAFVTRRVDNEIARKLALDECTKSAQREGSQRESDRCELYALGDDVVWTFRMPPLPAAPFFPSTRPATATLDLANAPLLTDKARGDLAETYLKASGSRALALGRRRAEFWLAGDSDADAVRRALQTCGHMTGRPCVLLSLNGELIVRPPQRYRAIEVFVPQDISDTSLHPAIEQYLVADDWRAVAVGRNGRIGIVSGRSSEGVAAADALRDCLKVGGTECAVTAIGPFLVAPR